MAGDFGHVAIEAQLSLQLVVRRKVICCFRQKPMGDVRKGGLVQCAEAVGSFCRRGNVRHSRGEEEKGKSIAAHGQALRGSKDVTHQVPPRSFAATLSARRGPASPCRPRSRTRRCGRGDESGTARGPRCNQ